MQLGELQNQIARFERRNTRIVAISVDAPHHSLAMIGRLGLTFDIASDPDQAVVKAYGVQNPDTEELALHAVYLLDEAGQVFYRKVALRRPTSNELIDAVDAHLGVYPQNDPTEPRRRIDVAYPQNNFQALLEMAAATKLPQTVSEPHFNAVLAQLDQGDSDESLMAFKRFIDASSNANTDDLQVASAHLSRRVFLDRHPEAMEAAKDLRRRLGRVRELEAALAAANQDERDELLQTLSKARAGLAKVRAEIGQNAQNWQLRFAKAMLRSYFEVSRAARVTPGP